MSSSVLGGQDDGFAAPDPACEDLKPLWSFEWWLNAGFAIGCVSLAALAAGLTMGLVAIEPFRLQILLETKERDCTSVKQMRQLRTEKEYARHILPLVSKHHRLLVTLLLLNSLANECLPLFLDEIVPTGVAIILSVTFVLLFGEIIPSAIFTGPNQLKLASAFVPVVRFVMLILSPIAYPIAKVLDVFLGEEHPEKFNKAELRALVKLHMRDGKISSQAKKMKVGGAIKPGGVHPPKPPLVPLTFPRSTEAVLPVSLAPRPLPLDRTNSSMSTLEIKNKLHEIGVDERTAAMAALATAAAQTALEEEEQDFRANAVPSRLLRSIPSTVHVKSAFDSDKGGLVVTGDLASMASAVSTTTRKRAHSNDTLDNEGLETDEVMIIQGAMDLKEYTAKDKMIPLVHCYMISADTLLTEGVLADMVAAGHSRIPVYDGERVNIRGLLLVKKLIVINPQDRRKVSSLYLRMPCFVKPKISLLELINVFQKQSTHVAIVTDSPERMIDSIKRGVNVPDDVNVYGMISLEDIIETLIKESIKDETDFSESIKEALFLQQRKARLQKLAIKETKMRKLAVASFAALYGANPHHNMNFALSDSEDDDDNQTASDHISYGSIPSAALSASPASSRIHNAIAPYAPLTRGITVLSDSLPPSSRTPLISASTSTTPAQRTTYQPPV